MAAQYSIKLYILIIIFLQLLLASKENSECLWTMV